MTEVDWFSGKHPEEMLELVADRFTPRRWRLLGSASVRKLWELLPDEPLRQALEYVELTDKVPAKVATKWTESIASSSEHMVEVARGKLSVSLQRVESLVPVQPDAPPQFPSEVLHRASVTFGQAALQNAGDAVTFAADAIRQLFDKPGPETFDRLFDAVKEADWFHLSARQWMVNALKMASEGDTLADEYSPRKARLDMARAEEIVRRIEQQSAEGAGERREKSYGKLLARLLHDLVGNPFSEYRFDPRWRTATVVDLARTIRDERAFDRMPILADALLDADCDEEAILRHCRGTEKHASEKHQHVRGCWVLDRILNPEDLLFTSGPLPAQKRKPRDWW